MSIAEIILQRKSIRGFKPDPVPKETLQNVLQIALHSPSAMNTQPWKLHIAAGDVLKELGHDNITSLTSGTPPGLEVKVQESHEGVYKTRQVDLAKQLFGLMEITREDQEGRFDWMQRGFRYFDAPAAILLAYENAMEPTSPLVHYDLGILAHAICLAALQYDLGTCIHGQGAMYPQNLRKHLNIPESQTIFNCISIGYPDWNFPANQVESKREPVENVASWTGI